MRAIPVKNEVSINPRDVFLSVLFFLKYITVSIVTTIDSIEATIANMTLRRPTIILY